MAARVRQLELTIKKMDLMAETALHCVRADSIRTHVHEIRRYAADAGIQGGLTQHEGHRVK